MAHGLIKRSDCCWELPQTGDMRVCGRVYASEDMLASLEKEKSLAQVANVATLPGIVKASLAMPDIHWGYGFPIGGVAAFDWEEGVISPGGVGYDINCGVRLATTGLSVEDLAPHAKRLADALFSGIPSGVGSTGSIRLSRSELKKVLEKGASWAVSQGYGEASDLEFTEDSGCMKGADPEAVGNKALGRGAGQLGTLGSGNHFVEVGLVEEIFDPVAASVFGLSPGQVTVMLHTGSRGLGYQVCDDSLEAMRKIVAKTGLKLPDGQLACAAIKSASGRRYFSAMAAAANFAWANRQVILHRVREVFMNTLSVNPRDLAMRQVYDVCHNIAKRESHLVDGRERDLCVHRKGATRAFGPGHPALPAAYKGVGQPVLVPGDMGTCSHVLRGTQTAMEETFGSSCHGAGRVMSRSAAVKASRGRSIHEELARQGIEVRWTGRCTLQEEIPEAYKDVNQVVDVAARAGIAAKVARLRPILVVKG